MTNPLDPTRTRIGVFSLLTEKEFTFRGFECAAWWNRVKARPQMAEITTNGYYVFVPGLHGINTGSNFTSQFGGVSYGAQLDEKVGCPDTTESRMIYVHEFARMLAEKSSPEGERFYLDPAWKVVVRSRHWDGNTLRPLYGLEQIQPDQLACAA